MPLPLNGPDSWWNLMGKMFSISKLVLASFTCPKDKKNIQYMAFNKPSVKYGAVEPCCKQVNLFLITRPTFYGTDVMLSIVYGNYDYYTKDYLMHPLIY